MLQKPDFNVEAHIAHLDASIFGIDLHWLAHANGALGIADAVKKVHPGAQVLLGGLSATYFHEELITDPSVDFILRGDSTEEPCRQLLQALREKTPLERVENLTWKRDRRDGCGTMCRRGSLLQSTRSSRRMMRAELRCSVSRPGS